MPRGPGVGDHDIHAPERLDHALEGFSHGALVGDVALDRECIAADLCRTRSRPSFVEIEQRDLGPRARESARRRGADCTGAAGDDGNLAGQRFFRSLPELRLLE